MVEKKSFFESITKDTVFDDAFYRKVYGYSLYDKNFLNAVATRFIEIDRKDVIAEFNKWVRDYEYSYNKELKEVVHRYVTVESPKQWNEFMKEYKPMKGVNEWKQRELLLKKKELLLKKKLLLLN